MFKWIERVLWSIIALTIMGGTITFCTPNVGVAKDGASLAQSQIVWPGQEFTLLPGEGAYVEVRGDLKLTSTEECTISTTFPPVIRHIGLQSVEQHYRNEGADSCTFTVRK